MALPELLIYVTEEEYKQHYIRTYCEACPIYTFDNIPVMFYEVQFDHTFYKRTHKSWTAEKDSFDIERGKRMDWIKHVLQDPKIVPRCKCFVVSCVWLPIFCNAFKVALNKIGTN